MRLYREEILALIARQPGLRTVQIADKIGCEIDTVEASIEAELGSGVIVKRDVIAPNKRKATAFWLGEAALVDPGARPRTKAEIAIDFIRAQPERIATSADLHRELGLLGHELPSSILADALADGRLLKEGKFWTVGGESAATGTAPSATNAPMAATPAAAVGAGGGLPRLEAQVKSDEPAACDAEHPAGDVVAQEGTPAAPVAPAAQEAGPVPAAPEPPTKAQLAMDFIRSQPNQEATVADLRTVMGLRSNQYPDPWLATLREKGEVHKDGSHWKLGPRRTITDQERDHVREVLSGQFRCALWNDGELQLVRGETTITKLSRTETEALRLFLDNARAAA